MLECVISAFKYLFPPDAPLPPPPPLYYEFINASREVFYAAQLIENPRDTLDASLFLGEEPGHTDLMLRILFKRYADRHGYTLAEAITRWLPAFEEVYGRERIQVLEDIMSWEWTEDWGSIK